MKKKIDNFTIIKGLLYHIVEDMYIYGKFISKDRADLLVREINKIKKKTNA